MKGISVAILVMMGIIINSYSRADTLVIQDPNWVQYCDQAVAAAEILTIARDHGAEYSGIKKIIYDTVEYDSATKNMVGMLVDTLWHNPSMNVAQLKDLVRNECLAVPDPAGDMDIDVSPYRLKHNI